MRERDGDSYIRLPGGFERREDVFSRGPFAYVTRLEARPIPRDSSRVVESAPLDLSFRRRVLLFPPFRVTRLPRDFL